MRNIIYSMVTSLDGFTEDSRGQIDWHQMDTVMEAYMADFMERVDALLLGRHTYQMLAGYWPTAQGNHPRLTQLMNALPKYVVSKSLRQCEWHGTLISGDVVQQLQQLKQQEGKHIALFGGATLGGYLVKQGLVDEYQQIINPILLGGGSPMFPSQPNPRALQLIDHKTFNNGNIVLRYRDPKKEST